MIALDDVVRRVHALPSLPAVAVQLLASMEQDDVDLHALAARITLDQSLTARTLRLANSSFYGMSSRVTSIGQAISVLGFHSIRTLVTTCCVMNSLAAPAGTASSFDFEGFWRHSIATAACARALARQLRHSPETAFTAGLLHDLGSLVLAINYPEQYAAAAAWRIEHDCGSAEAQQAVFGVDHAQVGSALAAHWNFPMVYQLAIAGHHQFGQSGESAQSGQSGHEEAAGSADSTLALTVCVANILAHALDLADRDDEQAPPLSPQVWRALALSDAAWLKVFAETDQVFQDMCQILVT